MRRAARGGRRAYNRGNEFAHDIFNMENLRQLMMFATAIVIGIALVVPRFAPELTRGGNCYNRPNILGGNQQSVLAAGDETQNLSLEVYIGNSIEADTYTVRQATPLEVIVVFRNNSSSPISLYLDEDRIAINRGEIPQGLALRINPEIDPEGYLADTRTIQNLQTQPFDGYDFDDVYVIEGHRSCHIKIVLDQDAFNRVGIVPGQDYEIAAIYNNTNVGTLFVAEDATATPMFNNLNVWDDGTIESDDITFTIIQ